MLGIGPPNFLWRREPNWLELLNSMAVYITSKALILIPLTISKKTMEESKDILANILKIRMQSINMRIFIH